MCTFSHLPPRESLSQNWFPVGKTEITQLEDQLKEIQTIKENAVLYFQVSLFDRL